MVIAVVEKKSYWGSVWTARVVAFVDFFEVVNRASSEEVSSLDWLVSWSNPKSGYDRNPLLPLSPFNSVPKLTSPLLLSPPTVYVKSFVLSPKSNTLARWLDFKKHFLSLPWLALLPLPLPPLPPPIRPNCISLISCRIMLGFLALFSRKVLTFYLLSLDLSW